MFTEYKRRTPNPDIICNREIKFDVFLKIAMSMNADCATGHYCQKQSLYHSGGKKVYRLLSGADKTKDQSIFYAKLISPTQKVIFPIGNLKKLR